jgi:hypothetical protein
MCANREDRRRALGRAAAIAAVALAAGAPPAGAAEGTIAFTHTPGYQVPFALMPRDTGSTRVDAIEAAGGPARSLAPPEANGPAWSPTGDRLAFVAEGKRGALSTRLWVAHPDGSRRRAVTRNDPDWSPGAPSWSPDGTRIVFERFGSGLATVAADGGRVRRLTDDGWDRAPAWGPDGRIAFSRFEGGYSRIYLVAADGTGATALTSGAVRDRAPAWSPDGTRIAFARESADRTDIYTMRPDGSDVVRVTAAAADESNDDPVWSPDGTEIAYSAWGPYGNDSEIAVIDPATGAVRVLTGGLGDDRAPAWRPGAVTAAATTARRKPRPLRDRRRRLPGLATWIRNPQEGNGSECQVYPPFLPPGPVVTFHTHQSFLEVRHAGRQEVGTRGFVCIYGFPGGSRTPFRVTLTHPGGTAERLFPRASTGDGTIAYWVARRGTGGTYTVDVARGSRSAQMRFQVVPADTPHLVVLDPRSRSDVKRRLGAPVSILLTGLPPGSRAWLDLYRATTRRTNVPPACDGCAPPVEAGHRYFNSVRVRAGGDGTALYRLSTSRKDRPGGYLVMLRVGRTQYSGAEFVMRRGR